jgi:hypothetical protein
VHRTLSGAPDQGCLSVVFCSFYLNPFLDFLLVCVEPLAPVKLILYSKLVSPICVRQFNHQNHLGKGVSLFPFQFDGGSDSPRSCSDGPVVFRADPPHSEDDSNSCPEYEFIGIT